MSNINVVMTSSRFGGRYFLDALGKCDPDLIILHEVLRKNTDSHRALRELTGLSLQQLQLMAGSEPETLWTMIAAAARKSDKNIVMLMYYYHQPRNSAVWNLVQQEARIIHLIRRNLFDAFISRQFAIQNNTWKVSRKNLKPKSDAVPMALDEKELRTYINDRSNDIEWARQKFGSSDYQEIYFEDITYSAATCLETIKKLDIATCDYSKSTVRLAQPIRQLCSNVERIANYAYFAKFDRFYP